MKSLPMHCTYKLINAKQAKRAQNPNRGCKCIFYSFWQISGHFTQPIWKSYVSKYEKLRPVDFMPLQFPPLYQAFKPECTHESDELKNNKDCCTSELDFELWINFREIIQMKYELRKRYLAASNVQKNSHFFYYFRQFF